MTDRATPDYGLPPRIADTATVTGVVRTIEALTPEGHYRITLDVDLTPPPPPAPGTPRNPVDGREDKCLTPGYGGVHVAVGAGAISEPYRCHGCGTWFVLPSVEKTRVIPSGDDHATPCHVHDYLDGDGFAYCQECTEATGDYVLVTDCPRRPLPSGSDGGVS